MHKCIRIITRSTVHQYSARILHSPKQLKQVPHHSPLRKYSSVSAAELQFGQPLHETHPHLLKPGELTPGITALEYAQRRSRLAAQLPPGAIAILAAADVKYRSSDVFYEFHQDSNFFYLTGFNEPDALAVIGRVSSEDDHTFHLYVREKDPKAEQWEGIRSGTQAALDVFNADETGDIADISRHLTPIIKSATKIYTDIPSSSISTPTSTSKSIFSRFTSSTPSTPTSLAVLLSKSSITPLKPTLNNIRAIKSPAEVSCMRQAGRLSGRAITSAMSQKFPSEAALAAHITHQFHLSGLEAAAYIPVVAGGPRGSIIHYTANNHLLQPHELVLVDAGGEYGGYITDITRTWPVSGRFSPPQRDLYSAVLAVQWHCISLCRANADVSLDGLHHIAESHLADSLSQLGFNMSGGNNTKAINTLFPHHLGHYIGLDVHDTPGLSRKENLRTGQCVTIEPGIYVPDEEGWPDAFRGLGVRIEDSVCVEEEGPVVLSVEAVKEVDDIEALRG